MNKSALEIGKIIRFHRKQAGISQISLAKTAGVGKTVIFDIEKNKISVQFNTLIKVCDALDIKLEYSSPIMVSYLEQREAQERR